MSVHPVVVFVAVFCIAESFVHRVGRDVLPAPQAAAGGDGGVLGSKSVADVLLSHTLFNGGSNLYRIGHRFFFISPQENCGEEQESRSE